jgi:hypothetical protein
MRKERRYIISKMVKAVLITAVVMQKAGKDAGIG